MGGEPKEQMSSGSRGGYGGFTKHRWFRQIRGTVLGSPPKMDSNIMGSILGPPTLGNYHMRLYAAVQKRHARKRKAV